MRCFDKAILVASVALCFNLSAFSGYYIESQ